MAAVSLNGSATRVRTASGSDRIIETSLKNERGSDRDVIKRSRWVPVATARGSDTTADLLYFQQAH